MYANETRKLREEKTRENLSGCKQALDAMAGDFAKTIVENIKLECDVREYRSALRGAKALTIIQTLLNIVLITVLLIILL